MEIKRVSKMIPRRFKVLVKYLEYRFSGVQNLPEPQQMTDYLLQPSERVRGERFIQSIEEFEGGFLKISLINCSEPIYFRKDMSWVSFCATVDETLNPKNWHYYQTDETPITLLDDIVVDCGCAEGLFSFVVAPIVKRVIAFEPLPRFLDLLEKTFYGLTNVEIRPYALGSYEGSIRFLDQGLSSRTSQQGNIVAKITTLDKQLDNVQGRVSFLRADIEGAEIDMLKGGVNMIKEHRPKIALTVYHDDNDVEEISQLLMNIHPDYNLHTKGIVANGNPVMLHAW